MIYSPIAAWNLISARRYALVAQWQSAVFVSPASAVQIRSRAPKFKKKGWLTVESLWYGGEVNTTTEWKTSFDALGAVVEKEHEEFKRKFFTMTHQEIYDSCYEIMFYEEYVNLFQSDYLTARLPGKVIHWLSEKEKPIAYLFEAWMDYDGSFSLDWDKMAEFIATEWQYATEESV